MENNDKFIEIYNDIVKYPTIAKVAMKLNLHSRTVGKKAKKLRDDGVDLADRSNSYKLDEVAKILSKTPSYRTPKKRNEKNKCVLVISDMHIPYHHEDLVVFLKAIKKKYKPDHVVGIGDECFPPDAEILTENGWEMFDSYSGSKVAQWDENREISFVEPERYFKKFTNEPLYEVSHRSYYSLTTQRHKIVKINPADKKAYRREAIDTLGTIHWAIPRAGKFDGVGVNFSESEINLQIAFQANGTFDNGAVKFESSKERNIQRLKEILNNISLDFIERSTKRNTTVIYIKKKDVPHYLSKQFNVGWVYLMTLKQREKFIEEIMHWSGNKTKYGIRYTSTTESNLDFVQSIAATCGLRSKKSFPFLNMICDHQEKTTQRTAKFNFVNYSGYVYCVTVNTGMIVVRQNGMVNITGNCDNHAMSYHESCPDTYSAGHELTRARKTIKEIEKLFPEMDIVDSNHGSLYYRKAKSHGIPREAMVPYNELLGVGDGWRWHFDLTLTMSNGNTVYFHHAKTSDVLTLSQRSGMCAVQGHYHSQYTIKYWSNTNGLYWGMSVGCLIDDNALAFSYNKNTTDRPIVGCGIIIDGQAKLLPMIKLKNGRWDGILY